MTTTLARQAVQAFSVSVRNKAAPVVSLKNPDLLPPVYTSQPCFDVREPAYPDSVIHRVPIMGGEHARKMIEQSHSILPSWRDGTTGSERGRLLREWSRLIQENAEDIAVIMTLESGKPLAESLGEVNYGRSFLDFYAAEAVRSTGAGGGMLIPTPFADAKTGAPRGQIMAIQQAVGVTAMITPWNFPIAMITRKVGPALAAGCTAIVKPSELTPLTAIALQQLAVEAGIPPHVVQLITADRSSTADVGSEFCRNPLVQKISFTGSTKVGKELMRQSSDTVKRVSLELGGNAPFIVFDDYRDHLDHAVDAAVASKFRNAGQTCVCADRFLIQEGVYDEFCARLAERVERMQMGDGMEPKTQIGPLITRQAVDSVAEKVREAVKEGALCLTGGNRREDLGPQFYEPTVLKNVDTDSRVWKTEIFGPVAPVRSFQTEEEALDIANACSVGLASYFCTHDLARAFGMAKKLEAGIVGVNEGIISSAVAPFGGIKESGLGREGSSMGIAEYLETKYIFMNY